MKAYSFFLKYVLVLFGVLAFASCSDDDNAGVMSSKVMLNQELVASNYSFIWNGVTSPRKDDVKAKFEAVEGDSTKMKMTISGIVPSSDDDIQLVVDVLPQSDEIQYQGKVENSDYDMTVSGVYFPSISSVGHYFKLKVVYNVTKQGLLEKPFVLNFKKGCAAVTQGDSDTSVIDGQEYSNFELAAKVLDETSKLYAKTDSAMQLTFTKEGDLSIDILNNVKGETSVSNLMSIKYWLTASNELALEFTKAQATTFAEKFLDANVQDIESLFTKYEDTDRYILKGNFVSGDKFCFVLNPDYQAKALSMFVNGRCSELDGMAQKQAKVLSDIVKQNPTDWRFQFVSE